MKGAYANGVLTSFERAGFHDWNVVIGTSAGGALAAWFSARQAEYAEGTWPYAADRRVLSYRRMMLGRPLLDHEALLDIVYMDEHPIDQDAIRRAPWRVIVTGSDVDTGSCVYTDLRTAPIIPWLKATGRLPLASGPAVDIDGRRYIDGGVVDPIPIRYAVEVLGATQIVLILNNPPAPKKADARWLAAIAGRRFPRLRDGLMRHQEIKAAAVAYAMNPPAGVTVDIIRPRAPLGIHRLSRDLPGIEALLERGRQDGAAFVQQAQASGPMPR